MSDLQGVTIGAREIYDELRNVGTRVDLLLERETNIQKRLDAHEDQLAGLNRWRFGIPVAAISGLAGIVLSILRPIGKA